MLIPDHCLSIYFDLIYIIFMVRMLHLKPAINSFATKKQTTEFSSANFQKMFSPNYITLRIQRLEGKQCRAR